MIYKLRNEIDVNNLNLSWLIDNPHPGAAKIIEEKIDDFEMDDFHYMLQYPHFMDIITKRLHILNSQYLSKNSDAIYLLIKNPDLIDWHMLSTNPSSKALEIIEENIISDINKEKGIGITKELLIKCPIKYSDYPLFWRLLATNTNPKAIELIEKYYSKLHPLYLDSESIDFWRDLSKNPNAVHLLEKYPRYIDWSTILENPNAVHIIEKNLNKIHIDDWPLLSGNPNAVHIFEQPEHLNKLYNWSYLSKNSNAMHIIKNNWDKVNWIFFSENPSAINIIIQILQEEKEYDNKIKNNQEINTKDYKYYDYFNKIDYIYLSENPAIFELDYRALKERCNIYKEELMQIAMHPSRIQKYLDMGFSIEELDNII